MALHDLDPERRFSTRADDYARFRPDYPEEAINFVLEGVERPAVVVDAGAGTGISSRQLAREGVHVIAIEPNAEMRKAAEPHPRVEFRGGSAESMPVGDASADVVACFQAFHWFRPDAAFREFARVLVDRGRIALVWNERDSTDPFTREYGAIVRAASHDHPAERRLDTSKAIYETPLFENVEHQTFRHAQRLSLDGLIGRTRSASYLPAEGAAFEELERALHDLYARSAGGDGTVTLVYRTEVYRAGRARGAN